MDIDPSQPLSKEFMGFNKRKKLLILDCGRDRQDSQRLEDFRSISQVAAGQFPSNERVTEDQLFLQQLAESRGVGTKVINPHGSIDEREHD